MRQVKSQEQDGVLHIASSTIGITAYNWIAIQNAGRSPEEILKGMNNDWSRANWSGEVTMERLQDALAVMLSKRLITFKNGVYDVIDASRRVVVSRNRTDDGGWTGWVVAKRDALKRLPIEAVTERR